MMLDLDTEYHDRNGNAVVWPPKEIGDSVLPQALAMIASLVEAIFAEDRTRRLAQLIQSGNYFNEEPVMLELGALLEEVAEHNWTAASDRLIALAKDITHDGPTLEDEMIAAIERFLGIVQ